MITLTNRTLTRLVKPVVTLADPTWPAAPLGMVHFRLVDGYLTATATDRIRAGISRVKLDADADLPDEFTTSAEATEIARALTLFRPGRRSYVNQPRVNLTAVPGGGLTLGSVPTKDLDEAHDFEQLTVTCRGGDPQQMPDIYSLVAKALGKKPGQSSGFGINLPLLAGFKDAVRIHSEDGAGVFVRTGEDPKDPLVIHIGDDFVGLMMPRKISTELQPDTKGLDESWTASLKTLSSTLPKKALGK